MNTTNKNYKIEFEIYEEKILNQIIQTHNLVKEIKKQLNELRAEKNK